MSTTLVKPGEEIRLVITPQGENVLETFSKLIWKYSDELGSKPFGFSVSYLLKDKEVEGFSTIGNKGPMSIAMEMAIPENRPDNTKPLLAVRLEFLDRIIVVAKPEFLF